MADLTRILAVDERALGTSMRVVVTDAEHAEPAGAAVRRVVMDIDACCSRFREDSELSRLNALAGHEAKVSPLLADALAAAMRGAELSGGAVAPTVGSAVKAAGYSVDFANVPRAGEPITVVARPVPGWRRIRFHRATRNVSIPAGVELDLGSTAKAFAADIAAQAAADAINGAAVLVSLGGDVAIGGAAPPDRWHIQVADDSDAPPDPTAETIAVSSGGVATSSITVRRWTRGGVEMHHIIDPATGSPVDGPWRTVTVCAGNCLDANIAATAAIVCGGEAVTWLEALGLPARLVTHEGSVTRTQGWPQPR